MPGAEVLLIALSTDGIGGIYCAAGVKLNEQKGEQLGFIAQEIEKIFPEMVINSVDNTITLADATKETIKKSKALAYSDLVVPLVKAVQELKAVFDGDHAELLKLKAANDNQAAALKGANDNVAALRKEFEAYKAVHP